jgi:replicative DNA helicase
LDRLTSGWQPSDLIIVAARPGMGKTSFTLALARNAALDFNKGVALFSLEMSNVQLVQRLISMEAEIQGSKLRSGQLEEYEWQQLHSAIEKMSEAPIFIDDTPGINVFELRAKCRRLKMQHDIQLVIIDYLQLMTGGPESKNGNREQEISQISRALKGLAKELSVPVIALSQLSRAVETRGGTKRPQLSDLRESGAIEQDADIVSFIYRPEYYQILEDEEGQSLKGVSEIIIAKHRNGALKTVKLKFTDQFAKFSDLDDPNFNELTGSNDSGTDPNSNIITRSSRMNDDDIPF